MVDENEVPDAGAPVYLSREEYQRLINNEQPNVVLANPVVRKVLNYGLGLAAVILPIATIVDNASAEINWEQPLDVASQIALFLTGALALGVTAQNINTSR